MLKSAAEPKLGPKFDKNGNKTNCTVTLQRQYLHKMCSQMFPGLCKSTGIKCKSSVSVEFELTVFLFLYLLLKHSLGVDLFTFTFHCTLGGVEHLVDFLSLKGVFLLMSLLQLFSPLLTHHKSGRIRGLLL